MKIPVIPDNILLSLQNQLESGFDSSTKDYTDECYKKGIFAMELLLGIGDNTEDCFYYEVKKDYAYKKTVSKSEHAIAVFLGVLLGLAIPVLIAAVGFVAYKMWGIGIAVCIGIIAILAVMFVLGAIAEKAERKRTLGYSNKTELSFNEWDMYETCTKSFIYSSNSDLEKICEKLGVDPTEAKIGLGKVKGGASTWVGWGSGRAIGVGIGLSAISSIGTAAKNSATNGRIKELENYIFYNNVAMYFNSEIMPKLLSSHSELLKGSPN